MTLNTSSPLRCPHGHPNLEGGYDVYLCVGVVVSPQWSDLVLTTDIPHCETDVLILDGLHVEAYRGNGRHYFAQLQLVQDRSLTSCVKTH